MKFSYKKIFFNKINRSYAHPEINSVFFFPLKDKLIGDNVSRRNWMGDTMSTLHEPPTNSPLGHYSIMLSSSLDQDVTFTECIKIDSLIVCFLFLPSPLSFYIHFLAFQVLWVWFMQFVPLNLGPNFQTLGWASEFVQD